MINPQQPDYHDHPGVEGLGEPYYQPSVIVRPQVSIITPFFNTGPVFAETVLAIRRMTFVNWEWIIVDDGSTDRSSLAHLAELQAQESRVKVLRQPNGGPAAARNYAAREARGDYLFQIDSDDLVEPTFLEKALWVLETQPQFAACNSYTVTFGKKQYLWPMGFQKYALNITENFVTNMAVIRREAYLAAGYDETLTFGHEDWDFWLNLAESGHWGYTIPEYLTWYRTQDTSRMVENERDARRAHQFKQELWAKHHHLARRFPYPRWRVDTSASAAPIKDEPTTIINSIAKPSRKQRVLFLVPWVQIGGADKFNLDVIESLSQRDFEFTVVTTVPSGHPWLPVLTRLTPDVFGLDAFLAFDDYSRFLDYLIASRQIDIVLISNSEYAYSILPYLRTRYAHLAFVDYTHSEVVEWRNGGYPRMSVDRRRYLDIQATTTEHLKNWMIDRGANPAQIAVCYNGVDSALWNREHYDGAAVREALGIEPDVPIILFVGRLSREKRPLHFARIIEQVAQRTSRFIALVVGDGLEEENLRLYLKGHRLEQSVLLLGAQPQEHIRAIMAASDILVLPSTIEGLALVLLEAMAMGVVPVAARVGGNAELLARDCGFLVAPHSNDLLAYTHHILSLLDQPALRERMARNARMRVATQFSKTGLIDSMESALRQAMQRARSRRGASEPLAQVQRHVSHQLAPLRLASFTARQHELRMNSPLWQRLFLLKQQLIPRDSRRNAAYAIAKSAFNETRWALGETRNRFRAWRYRSRQPLTGPIIFIPVTVVDAEDAPSLDRAA